MGLVLEELPTGRVFVASLAEGGSAALSRGGVLPGDRIVAVQGVPCESQGLASVMAAVASVTDTAGVTMSLSRDARVLPVNFDGGMPVAALAGEPLRDIAGMSPAMLLYVAVSA
jgi:C-terminal processing protease CtpA/Prc